MRRGLPVLVGALAAALAFTVVMVASGSDSEVATPSADPAPAQTEGLQVFSRMGCGGCHHLSAAGSTGVIGPNLDFVVSSHTAESLEAKITSPTPGTAMPEDFEKRMTAAELDALVGYLLQAGR